MKQIKKLAVVGGDGRQLYMAKALIEHGFEVFLCGFDKNEDAGELKRACVGEAIRSADAVILPIPASRNGVSVNAPFSDEVITLDSVIDDTDSGKAVFAGMLDLKRRSDFFKKGVLVYDYADRDEFAVKNAVPTAEGVIALVIGRLPVTIKDTLVCVTGYGKTARAVAKAFRALGARVTVAARKCSSLAFAQNDGNESIYISDLRRYAGIFDVLVNTVPAQIIGRDILSALKHECLLIEIASAPYGIDLAAAAEQGLEVNVAGSLPGKTAPQTAGRIISDTILNIMREWGE